MIFKVLEVKNGLEQELKDKSIEFLKNILSVPNKKEQFPTDNYQDIAELSLAVHGEGHQVPGGFRLKKPGAFHKARFMANVIYGSQMFLLQNSQVDEEIASSSRVDFDFEFDDEYKSCLERFVKFTSLIYVPYFLVAPVGADAAFRDLELFKNLVRFREIDIEVSEAAILVFKRHLFYLTEENIVTSQFSNRLTGDEKSEMASKLLTFDKPTEFKIEKPKVPTNLSENTQLKDLVGENSWMIFHVLGLSHDWLEQDPSKWCEDKDYCVAEEWVRTAKVVNDSCERAIKLIQDYCNILTNDTYLRRGLLKAVESCREEYPNFNKETLNK